LARGQKRQSPQWQLDWHYYQFLVCPGTALDEENMEGFVRILDMVKGYFKTVILISHLDVLKDCVDSQILIEKHKGFAHVNV